MSRGVAGLRCSCGARVKRPWNYGMGDPEEEMKGRKVWWVPSLERSGGKQFPGLTHFEILKIIRSPTPSEAKHLLPKCKSVASSRVDQIFDPVTARNRDQEFAMTTPGSVSYQMG